MKGEKTKASLPLDAAVSHRVIENPDEASLNALGADGYVLVAVVSKPADPGKLLGYLVRK